MTFVDYISNNISNLQLGICLCFAAHVLLNSYALKITSIALSTISTISLMSLSVSFRYTPKIYQNTFRLLYLCLTCISGINFYRIFAQQNNVSKTNANIICHILIAESLTLLISVILEFVQTYINIVYNGITEFSELEHQLQEEEKKEALKAVWKASVKLEKAKEELEKHRGSSSTVRSRSCLNQDPKISELETLIKQLELKLRYKRQVYSDLLHIPLIPPPYPTTQLDFEDIIATVPAK